MRRIDGRMPDAAGRTDFVQMTESPAKCGMWMSICVSEGYRDNLSVTPRAAAMMGKLVDV